MMYQAYSAAEHRLAVDKNSFIGSLVFVGTRLDGRGEGPIASACTLSAQGRELILQTV